MCLSMAMYANSTILLYYIHAYMYLPMAMYANSTILLLMCFNEALEIFLVTYL